MIYGTRSRRARWITYRRSQKHPDPNRQRVHQLRFHINTSPSERGRGRPGTPHPAARVLPRLFTRSRSRTTLRSRRDNQARDRRARHRPCLRGPSTQASGFPYNNSTASNTSRSLHSSRSGGRRDSPLGMVYLLHRTRVRPGLSVAVIQGVITEAKGSRTALCTQMCLDICS